MIPRYRRHHRLIDLQSSFWRNGTDGTCLDSLGTCNQPFLLMRLARTLSGTTQRIIDITQDPYDFTTASPEVIMSLTMPVVSSVDIEYSAAGLSDEMLASRAKSGDRDAFVELSKRHANRVLQTTYRLTRNRQDAEDALQDAFLNAFTHMKDFEGRSSFSTWLTRIAINSALMILRKKRKCYEIPIDDGDGSVGSFVPWEPRSPMDDPESHYVRGERHELLRKAIHQLPPIYREVIQLQEAKERSLREIAQSLGITVPAVKSRLSRAKSALRTSMI
jgi:RNA polymerase sigma factor (sigma-70 family)